MEIKIGKNLRRHHDAYIETHGYDKCRLMTVEEHYQIDHRALFPNITSKELRRISVDARWRNSKELLKHEHSIQHAKYYEANKKRLKEYDRLRYLEKRLKEGGHH